MTGESALMGAYEWIDDCLTSIWGVRLPGGRAEQELRCAQDDIATKAARIEACLSGTIVNLWELRELALSKGGLLEPRFRQQAWPLLVGLPGGRRDELRRPNATKSSRGNRSMISPLALLDSTNKANHSSLTSPAAISKFVFDSSEDEKKMEQEACLDLIRRDVGRSVVFRYNKKTHAQQTTQDLPELVGENSCPSSRSSTPLTTPSYASARLARALEDTIKSSAQSPTSPYSSPRSRPQQPYHYFQGLHDVAGAVLHQLDYEGDLGTCILQKLAQSHWRDALHENFGNLTWILSHIFLPLLEKVDPQIHYQLVAAHVEMANLLLPWMITWFTHDIFDATTAGRIVDAFVASHPLLPLYMGVALLTHPVLRPSILEADPNDPASLFVLMKLFPKQIASDSGTDSSTSTVPVQELLDDALTILQKFPPRALLDLIDPILLSRAQVLQRANSISFFKAASSWNVACTIDGVGKEPTPSISPFDQPTSSTPPYVRAKLASGIPLLMATIRSSRVATAWLSSPEWGSRRYKGSNNSTRGGRSSKRFSTFPTRLKRRIQRWINRK